MRTELFDYDLPEDLIAQSPLPRERSRLLVLHRADNSIEHRLFSDLTEYLEPADLLVVNNARVSGRRLAARRENGLPAEVLLIAPHGAAGWHALVRPGRTLRPGRRITLIGPDLEICADIVSDTADGGKVIELPDADWQQRISTWGDTPLPPYIHNRLSQADEERYQTVYSAVAGSAAAPTAGLHFTPNLLKQVSDIGVRIEHITLHVGVGTFRPVRSSEIEDHVMHREVVTVSPKCAHAVNSAKGRVIAVGTTTVRALESSVNTAVNPTAAADNVVRHPGLRALPFNGETNLFITPGYEFKAVDALVTNFHQPKSTLLVMIAAFAGLEMTHKVYQEAIDKRYRFFSFGDAMLIL